MGILFRHWCSDCVKLRYLRWINRSLNRSHVQPRVLMVIQRDRVHKDISPAINSLSLSILYGAWSYWTMQINYVNEKNTFLRHCKEIGHWVQANRTWLMYVVVHAYTRWIISNITEKGNCSHYIICTRHDLSSLHFFFNSLAIRIISIHLHTLVLYKILDEFTCISDVRSTCFLFKC